jgi:serine/threonine protein kinase
MSEDQELRQIGPYAVLERLDAGGSAEVFVGQREGDSKLCVLKRLHTRLEGHPTAPKRLYREAHLASYLRHPHIAEIIGASAEDGRWVIAFEFVAGQTVEAMMQTIESRKRRVPLDACLAIAFSVLDALEYAHDLKDPDGKPFEIVHRDLSPRNVMVGYDGVVKLIDFGVAHGNIDEFRTEPGVVVGTLRYLSPEQALTLEVDRRSDLYTLAVVLFELITGTMLVPDGAPLDILRFVVNQPAPLLSEVDERLPRGLDPVFARALAKDRELRFPNARAFKEALSRIGTLPRPSSTSTLGALVSDLFPEGVEWAKRVRGSVDPVKRGSPVHAPDDDETRSLSSGDVTLPRDRISFRDRTRSETIDDLHDPEPTEVGPPKPVSRPRPPLEDTNPPRAAAFASQTLIEEPIPSIAVQELKLHVESLERTNRRLRFALVGIALVGASSLLLAGALAVHVLPVDPPARGREESSPRPAPDPDALPVVPRTEVVRVEARTASTAPTLAAETPKPEDPTIEDPPKSDKRDEPIRHGRAKKHVRGRSGSANESSGVARHPSTGDGRLNDHPAPERLRKMVEEMKLRPADAKIFDQLARAVKEEAERLPAGDQKRRIVEVTLRGANQSRSPDMLEKAVSQLSIAPRE